MCKGKGHIFCTCQEDDKFCICQGGHKFCICREGVTYFVFVREYRAVTYFELVRDTNFVCVGGHTFLYLSGGDKFLFSIFRAFSATLGSPARDFFAPRLRIDPNQSKKPQNSTTFNFCYF